MSELEYSLIPVEEIPIKFRCLKAPIQCSVGHYYESGITFCLTQWIRLKPDTCSKCIEYYKSTQKETNVYPILS